MPSQTSRARPLRAADFELLAEGGFGDPYNNRAQALAWFDEHLYVGVSRQGQGGAHKLPAGRRAGRGPGAEWQRRQRVQRGQIWRFDGLDWEPVAESPLVAERGDRAARESGYRRMVVFQGDGDEEPVLYVSTISARGSLILRSQDGYTFEPTAHQPDVPGRPWSYRALASFEGRLYAAPAGQVTDDGVQRNAAGAAVVYAASDPAGGAWVEACDPGFGDPANGTVYELSVAGDHLYAGTFNPVTGCQVWRTAGGRLPHRWTQVIADGGGRGPTNEAASSICAFAGAVFVGTGQEANQGDDGPRRPRVGGEVLRLDDDGSVSVVVGDRRRTGSRWRAAASGLGPGFGSDANGVVWEMAAHEGCLYAGTEDRVALNAALARPGGGRSRTAAAGDDDREPGFDLWCTPDGVDWSPVTTVGFGSPHLFGLESMCSTPWGLFVGTVAVPVWPWTDPSASRGCEVWRGM